MTNLDRRTLIVGALSSSCIANGLGQSKNLENDFYNDNLQTEFTLGFKFKDFCVIKADNGSFSLSISRDVKSSILSFGFETYLKKYQAKPLDVKLSASNNELVLIWDSDIFAVYLNKIALIKIQTKRRSTRHARPLLKQFSKLSYSGLTSKIKSYNRKIEVAEFEKLFSDTLKVLSNTILGPAVGEVRSSEACVWIRGVREVKYELEIYKNGKRVWNESKQASKKSDLTIHWSVKGLEENTEYKYKLSGPGTEDRLYSFKTASYDNEVETRLLFGSCASMKDENLYKQFTKLKPNVISFMGDSPYIDSGNLEIHRHSYREFLRIKSISETLKTTPHISTWDDHDFGTNNCDGKFPFKKNSIKAFKEYRAQSKYGNGSEGIYSSFRSGAMEVFMLDCRWFSYLKKSTVATSKQKTLLGEEQWQWLFDSLLNSTAVFKVLACGIIWDDKLNKEKDDWETYSDERKYLFEFIKSKKISGVVLLGGDIHVSRHLNYSNDHVGYPLHQFISSPMHNSVIKSLNTKHECLKWSALQKNTCLILETKIEDNKTLLRAKYLNESASIINQVTIDSDDLKRH